MANLSSSEAIEQLAATIGEVVYIDVAKWHLYLSDAHLDKPIAEQLLPLLTDGKPLDENAVLAIFQNTVVKIGNGKRDLPLIDLIPMQCQVNLMDALEEFQHRL